MTETRNENYVLLVRRQLEGGFLALLALLLLLYVLAPIVHERTAGSIATNFLFYVAMLAAIRASVRSRKVFLVVLAVAIVAWLTSAVDDIFDIPALGIPTRIVSPVLLVLTPTTVLARVLRDERVTLNTVYGAVCVYFLIALYWAFVFFLIEEMDPGSFALPDDSSKGFADFLYFSVVTQTTLGYGDITPVADLPRQLAALQAFIGQVFLVVTVARLVALQIAYSGRAGDARADREPGASQQGAASGDRGSDDSQ